MKKQTILIVAGIAAIVVVAFLGLAPLPGQKDNVTPQTEPGAAVKAEPPKGPPHEATK